MQQRTNNVLLPMACPSQSSLRSAVANMIRDIQRDYHESDQDTADNLGVSAGTISNARNSKADLGAVTIARIGHKYGAHYVDPYHRLYGACAQTLQISQSDPLAPLAESVATLCRMRSQESEGGRLETPKEQLDALPILKNAARELTAYIASIESLRVAA